jgi:16S rRNA (adenine1518-N6/adenine1519-N6)-dimethyltransferase
MEYIKKFGQNFLGNEKALEKITEVLEIEKNETILEIGGGSGNLTKKILKQTDDVIVIEKDRRLITELKNLSKSSSFKVVEGDCRDVLSSVTDNLGKYKICGNIPYYLTGQLLRITQELKNSPQMVVFTMQKEVAERMVGEGKETQLSIITKLWAEPEIMMNLKAEDFYPKPKVDSSVIKLLVLSKEKRQKEEKNIIALAKVGFLAPKKTLYNNLSSKFTKEKIKKAFEVMNLSDKIRAHDLNVLMWINLAKILLD